MLAGLWIVKIFLFGRFHWIAPHTVHLCWWFHARVDDGNNDGKDYTCGVALCDKKCSSLTIHGLSNNPPVLFLGRLLEEDCCNSNQLKDPKTVILGYIAADLRNHPTVHSSMSS